MRHSETINLESIRDLRIFVAIYEQGGISSASQRLHISPALASKRLRALESQVGQPLFHRSTRKLSPSSAAVTLYDDAKEILATVERVRDRLDIDGDPRGLLRVTASIAFGRLFLADVITRFMSAYPGVTLDAIFTDRIVNMVEERIDVAIRISPPLEDSAFVMRRLGSGRRLPCASPEYLARRGTPDTPGDLLEHNCLILNDYDIWTFESSGQTSRVQVTGTLRSNNGEMVFDAVKAGLGIGIIALWNGHAEISGGSLVPVLSEYHLCGQPDLFAVYDPRQRDVPRVRRFVDFARDNLHLPD